MATNPSLGASLIVLALLPAHAVQAMDPLEAKWKQSIEVDLRNGDPAGQVCTKAKIQASISDDVAFKTWAYDIARRTCPPGTAGSRTSNQQPQASPTAQPVAKKAPPATFTWGCPLLSSHNARIIASGRRLRMAGGGCVMSFN
jgi:hypothetical protein